MEGGSAASQVEHLVFFDIFPISDDLLDKE